MRRDLTAEFASYRTASARNENDFTFDITDYFVNIDGYGFTPQKVLNIDVPHLRYRNLSVCELVHAG